MHTCRCALLCTLLSSVPHDATIGHTELAALQPLLTLMKGQRADPELQGTACRTIAMLGGRSVTLAKQLARVGAVKTLLLTMRAHLKVEEVSTHTYTYTHTHTHTHIHTHTHTMRAHLEVGELSEETARLLNELTCACACLYTRMAYTQTETQRTLNQLTLTLTLTPILTRT